MDDLLHTCIVLVVGTWLPWRVVDSLLIGQPDYSRVDHVLQTDTGVTIPLDTT